MLKLEGICKQFSSTEACSNINLEIRSGEFFSLLGPSGCGKTTLLRIIAGLIDADDGSLHLDEQCLDFVPAHERNINTVFQNYALFPHLNVFDNVAFGLKMKGIASAEIRKRVGELLDLVELVGFDQRRPNQLSGGQQQRVALARALVNRPQVLLLDEPLAALDVKLRKQMQSELRHLQNRLGMTFVYVTHDQEEAMRMSDRIAVMKSGKVEQVGPPEEIYDQPKTHFVAGFIGESNFFESKKFLLKDTKVEVYLTDALTISGRKPDGYVPSSKLTLAVRPEKIRIISNGHSSEPNENCLPATIEEVIYLGTTHQIVARLSTGQVIKVLRQTSDHESPCRVGDAVQLLWSAEHTIAIAD